jgi:hypothetical protein
MQFPPHTAVTGDGNRSAQCFPDQNCSYSDQQSSCTAANGCSCALGCSGLSDICDCHQQRCTGRRISPLGTDNSHVIPPLQQDIRRPLDVCPRLPVAPQLKLPSVAAVTDNISTDAREATKESEELHSDSGKEGPEPDAPTGVTQPWPRCTTRTLLLQPQVAERLPIGIEAGHCRATEKPQPNRLPWPRERPFLGIDPPKAGQSKRYVEPHAKLLCVVQLIMRSSTRHRNGQGTIAHGLTSETVPGSNTGSGCDMALFQPTPEWEPAIEFAQDHRANLFTPLTRVSNKRFTRAAISNRTAAASSLTSPPWGSRKAGIRTGNPAESSGKEVRSSKGTECSATQSENRQLSATRITSTVRASHDELNCINVVQEHGARTAVEESFVQDFNRIPDADDECETEHCEFASDGHAQPGSPGSFENTDVSEQGYGTRARSSDDGLSMPECHPTDASTIAVSPDIGGDVPEEYGSQVRGVYQILRLRAVADQVAESRARSNASATMSTNGGEPHKNPVGR